MKKGFWYFGLLLLYFVAMGSFLGASVLFSMIIDEKATVAEDLFDFIVFVLLFFLCSYFAGYIYWEKKIDLFGFELDLCLLEWPIFVLQLIGLYVICRFYLFVQWNRLKSQGNRLAWREYVKKREEEWKKKSSNGSEQRLANVSSCRLLYCQKCF